ncbi:MAG: hypothetical protein ACR2LI_15125 [Propionibacteriaceae bacterium]
MPRRSGAETRQLLLQTGMEMLLARGVSAGVQHIRLQEVVRRAQLTTGAAYRLWADQDDFHRDLAVAVTRWRNVAPVAETRRIIDDPAVVGASPDEAIRLAAAAHIRAISGEDSRSSKLFLAALALRASARTWDDLTRASVERHLESVAEFEEIYGQLMAAYGYRMRSPLTVRDFTVAMAALGEGFAVHAVEGIPHPSYRAEEPGDDADDAIALPGGEWTLFAIAVRALVEGFMTRNEPGGVEATAPGPATD